MGRLAIPRLLTTGSVIGAATSARLAAGCLGLIAARTPSLMTLAVRASLGGPGTERAQATFRDELIGLAGASAEISWRELRRGVDQLDASTRPDEPPATGPPPRPYRVKS